MTTPALIGQPSEAGALAMTYGLLPGGSVLTAPPRRPRRSGCCSAACCDLGVLSLMAPASRCLVGRTDYATGGSLLAVGVLHASWNASGQLSVVDGDLQYVIGLVIVATRPGSRRGPGPVQLGSAVRPSRPASGIRGGRQLTAPTTANGPPVNGNP